MAAQSYAGELLPEEAHRLLEAEPKAVLVDVRTPGEWQQVGLPDLGALGKETRLRKVPDFALKIAGLFAPILGEVAEMTYQWKMPFVLDDSRFRKVFGAAHTPVEEQVRATAAWAKSHFRAAA